MKWFVVGFSLAIIFIPVCSSALRLTDGLFFTVAPNSTSEIYFILPDDVGAGSGKADYKIKTSTNWSVDLTEQDVFTEENNTVIIPIIFYSSGKKEGDCSNYTISVSAPKLMTSKVWRGGVCLSRYMDVDISKTGSDPKKVLNENVDLFSIGFLSYTKNSKPFEPVSIELLLQSQATLTIDVKVTSDFPFEKKDFVIQTSPASQYITIYLNGTANSSGTYYVSAEARARNCTLPSCTKQTAMKIIVSESEPSEGFSVSLFPDNLAIKKVEPLTYRFAIQNNYKEGLQFLVNVEVPFDLDSSLLLETVTVSPLSQKIVDFTVNPRNQTGFYEIKATASARGMKKTASAYLSVNEMVSDVYRNAEDALSVANSSVKKDIEKAVRNWYSSYMKSEYGSNITGYSSLQDAIDDAKRQTLTKNESCIDSGEDIEIESQEGQNNLVFVIPLICVAVLIIFLLFRKRNTKSEPESLDDIIKNQ
ncbi:MAG: hypothetical protein QW286_00495 [Candidatus Aenigmatarchaeota archaeon]